LENPRQKSAAKISDLLNPNIHQSIIYEKVGVLMAAPPKKLS
jgi:hypothetical protein